MSALASQIRGEGTVAFRRRRNRRPPMMKRMNESRTLRPARATMLEASPPRNAAAGQPDGAGERLMRHAARLESAPARGSGRPGRDPVGRAVRESGPKPQTVDAPRSPQFARGVGHFLVSRGDPPDVRSLDGPQEVQARRHQGGPALLLESKQAFRPRRIGRSHGGLGSPVPGWPVRVSAAAAVQENNVDKAFFLELFP